MSKDQLDLENKTVWIPDSKTPNGVAEVPLTEIAVEAFRKSDRSSLGPGPCLFPSEENPDRVSEDVQEAVWHATLRRAGIPILSDLRSPLHIRHPAQRRRRRGRVGHAVAPARRCEGIQEVLADEAADEARGAGETEPPGQRKRPGFWHSQQANPSRVLTQFWHSRGKGRAKTMARRLNNSFGISRRFGRGGAIRTPDPLRPRQVRYQAALRPDILCSSDSKPLPRFAILSGLPKSVQKTLRPWQNRDKTPSVGPLRVKTRPALIRLPVQLL